jgi:hypothetical protein
VTAKDFIKRKCLLYNAHGMHVLAFGSNGKAGKVELPDLLDEYAHEKVREVGEVIREAVYEYVMSDMDIGASATDEIITGIVRRYTEKGEK